MKLTIYEIAEKIGVSASTVSRAINHSTRSKVSDKTLKKIDAVVQRYGFVPNQTAQNLRLSTSKTIGVLLPYHKGIFYHPYFRHIFSGTFDCLFETNYKFKTVILQHGESRWEKHDFKNGEGVDGLIISAWPSFFKSRNAFKTVNVPCVLINDYDPETPGCYVCHDDFQGGYLAASHFYARGHRRLAIMRGRSWGSISNLRVAGFLAFLKEHNLTVDEHLIVNGEFNEQDAYRVSENLLKSKDQFTGVFCCNDQMALGLIQKLKEKKISYPDDISIIGFDDITEAGALKPSLTTIRSPIYDIAREATLILITHLADNRKRKKLDGYKKFPVSLIERASVKKIIS